VHGVPVSPSESRSHRDREPDCGGDIIAIHDGRKGIDVSHAGSPSASEKRSTFCMHRALRGRSFSRKPPQALPNGAPIPDGHHRRPGNHTDRGLTHRATKRTDAPAPPPGGKKEKKGKTDDRPAPGDRDQRPDGYNQFLIALASAR